MRPLDLTIRAFGPFAGEQVIDFRPLKDHSLFLIHGPTGAGKTSILDAMSFALYGECSGHDRDSHRVRSHHAHADTLTEVEFSFRLGPHEYRVFRRPEQLAPKKRGEGTRTVRAEATLSRTSGRSDGQPAETVLASGLSRVTDAVKELLGFHADQFRQVVILPQGEFRRLLLADSRSRQNILETLFETELYRRIEETLKSAARDIHAEIQQTTRDREGLLKRIDAADEDGLREHREALRARVAELETSVLRLKTETRKVQGELDQARAIAERMTELENARGRLRSLEAQTARFGELRQTLDAARRALQLLSEERSLEAREHEAGDAADKRGAAERVFGKALAARQEAERDHADHAARRPQCEELNVRIVKLQELRERVITLDRSARERASAKRGEQNALADMRASEESLERFMEEKERITTLQRQREEQGSQSKLLAAHLEEAKRHVQGRKKLQALETEQASLDLQVRSVAKEQTEILASYQSERDALRSLERSWMEGQAGLLAATLTPGNPCPVCGSLEHPSPAARDAELRDSSVVDRGREKLDAVSLARDEIAARLSRIQQKVSENRASRETLRETLGSAGDSPLKDLVAEENRLKRELAAALAGQKEAEELGVRLQAIEQSLSEARTIRDDAQKRHDLERVRHERADAEVSSLQRDIPPEFVKPAALEAALKQAKVTARLMEESWQKAVTRMNETGEGLAAAKAALSGAQEAEIDAARRAGLQRESFEGTLKTAGFRDRSHYLQNRKTSAEIERLAREIEEFDGLSAAARDRVRRAETAAAGLEMPDLPACEARVRAAREALERTVREETALAEKLKRVDDILLQYSQTTAVLQNLESRYGVLGHISEVASGGNPDGITFQRYVLGALLDDVLSDATNRLWIMSNNRYTLHRVRGRQDRRIASGLDLEVLDAYTGLARPVSTLSGGESFLASLALALGLADVVQSYAGGLHLDTLFVDEGFGSLDPESLDLALRALIDLQHSGRLIGVISHVPELRERIEARLEVIPHQRGSRARLVV